MTTMTLTEFLTARIDEDEIAAGRWGGHYRWFPDVGSQGVVIDQARLRRDVEAKRAIVERAGVTVIHIPAGSPGFGADVMFSDGRVYLGASFSNDVTDEWEAWAAQHQDHADPDTLRTLAAVYADHPDYRDEWRP